MSCFRQSLLAGWALLTAAATTAWGAVTLQDFHVSNVGTTTFTAVWTTSEVSTPVLDVFADSEGTQPLSGDLSLEYYPIAEGDPGIVNDPAAREARRSLQELAIQRRVVVVRVGGLEPGTTYHVRPRSVDGSGADNTATPFPLQPATTAQVSELVPDGGLLRVRFPALAAEGMVALLQGPEGTLPLSVIVGDSADPETALIPLANLIDAATGTNAVLTGPQPITVRLLGAEAPARTFTQQVNFENNFAVARAPIVETDFSSPAPFFKQHPSDVTGAMGGAATFSVEVTGTPAPTLRWQRNPAGSDTWMDLSEDNNYTGTTRAQLVVQPLSLAMSGDAFRVRAFNGVPPDAFSDAAVLTVLESPVAPLILSHPESISAVQGGTAAFTVAASGVPAPTFQWQRQAAGTEVWTDLTDNATYSGSQTDTLTIVGVATAMHGDRFRAVASNGIEPNAVSQAATLSVSTSAVAPTITGQPQSQEVALGETATFAVAATGVPTPSYQWQRRAAGSDDWKNLVEDATYVGVTSVVLDVNVVTAAMSGDAFRVIASNGTPPDATSAAAELTVLTPPVIEQQPQSVAVTPGGAAQFSVAATGSGELTYLWQRRASGSDTWNDLTDGGVYAGATTPTLTVSPTSMGMGGDQFRVRVTNAVGSVTSEAATLELTQSQATVTVAGLQQRYDGQSKPVVVTTEPEGLSVTVTYQGTDTPPTVPGVYAVVAQITEPGYTGSATAELIITTDVVVRRAPSILGGVSGSVQVQQPEAITLKGWIDGDLLVPGTPAVVGANNPAYGGTLDGPGASNPTNYSVTLDPASALRHVVRRVDPITWPVLPPVPQPTGTRNVVLSNATQSPGDFATMRNLVMSGNAGTVTLPPGTYGTITINGTGILVLGVAGATEPAVYNLQAFSINQQRQGAQVVLAGPVILNVQGNVTLAADLVGETADWLQLSTLGTALNVHGTALAVGHLSAPQGTVTLYDQTTVRGTLVTDRLSITVGAEFQSLDTDELR